MLYAKVQTVQKCLPHKDKWKVTWDVIEENAQDMELKLIVTWQSLNIKPDILFRNLY